MRALVLVVISFVLFHQHIFTENILDKVLVGDGGQKLQETVNSVVDGVKQAWDGAGAMLEGMGQGFGVVSKDYYYNYRVFNDAPAPIFVAEERLTGIMGTNFSGEIKKGLVLMPNCNTKDEFYHRQLYVSVWICADENEKAIRRYATGSKDWAKYGTALGAPMLAMGLVVPAAVAVGLGAGLAALAGSIATVVTLHKYKLYEKDIYPWGKHDDNIYYYRAYTYQGKLKAEYLGFKGVTQAFSGQFYNSSNEPVLLKFIKDDVEYVITLEPHSFNNLESSDKEHSIRPAEGKERAFQFYKNEAVEEKSLAYLPIGSEGLAYMTVDDKNKNETKPTYVVGGPMLYTYEVHDAGADGNKISVQGLSIGNYDQPVSGKIRDINPAQCHFWYKSATQETASLNKNDDADNYTQPFDVPETVWISYKTKDSIFQQKINPGQVIDFNVVRPQLIEGNVNLFALALDTNDDAKAKKFLERLHQGVIGAQVLKTSVSKSTDTAILLTDLQPNQNSVIDDTQQNGSGVRGTLLLTDVFTPKGLGSGPFYYQIEPSVLHVDQFANAIWYENNSYETDAQGQVVLKKEIMQELKQKLPTWIATYKTNAQGAADALKIYLQEKGNEGLFVNAKVSTNSRQFNKQGAVLYQTLLTGPVSLKNYPIMRKAGTNYYILTWGEKPEGWPIIGQ